jgi:hypothetical protein
MLCEGSDSIFVDAVTKMSFADARGILRTKVQQLIIYKTTITSTALREVQSCNKKFIYKSSY